MFGNKKSVEELKQELEAKLAEEAQKLRKEYEDLGANLAEQVKKVSSDLTIRVTKLDQILSDTLQEVSKKAERAQQIIDRDSVFMNTTIDEMDGVLKDARSSTVNAHLKLAEAITLLAKTLGAKSEQGEEAPAVKAPEPKSAKKKR